MREYQSTSLLTTLSEEHLKELEQFHSSISPPLKGTLKGYADNSAKITIEDRTIPTFKGLSHLRKDSVLFRNCKFGEHSDLSLCDDLTHINFTGSDISDLSALTTLERIEKLLLGDTKVVDIKPLINLPELEYLTLNNCELNDSAWDYLGMMKQLKTLAIRGVNFAPEQLSGLTHLDYLIVDKGKLPKLVIDAFKFVNVLVVEC